MICISKQASEGITKYKGICILLNKTKLDIIDWLGFIGVFQILLAYILTTVNIIENKDLTFILLNLVGAGMACLASILINYWPFIILEGAWTAVSLFSLIKYKPTSQKKESV